MKKLLLALILSCQTMSPELRDAQLPAEEAQARDDCGSPTVRDRYVQCFELGRALERRGERALAEQAVLEACRVRRTASQNLRWEGCSELCYLQKGCDWDVVRKDRDTVEYTLPDKCDCPGLVVSP